MNLVINGRLITRDTEGKGYYEHGAVAYEGSKIVEVGEESALRRKYPDAHCIDARGGVIMPALINAHTHIYSALARGLSIVGNNPTNFYEVLDGTWWAIDRKLMVEKLLENVDVMLETDFFAYRKEHPEMFHKVVYTGMIDEYFDYCYGHLEYRTVRFETERVEESNFQGNAVVNYTERAVPYTRVIEHKHFAPEEEQEHPKDYSIISREYSTEWKPGIEPYYPVNDEKNGALYQKYQELAKKEETVIFGGRLGQYKYYDMDKVIRAALDAVELEGRGF